MTLRDEVLADNPEFYLDLSEATGPFQDSSPNNRDAARIGSGPMRTPKGAEGAGQIGMGGGSGFDLLTSYPAPPTNNWSLMLWVAPNVNIAVKGESTGGTTGNQFDQAYVAYPEQRGAGGGCGVSVGKNAIQIFEHGDSYIPCLLSYVPAQPFPEWRYLCLHVLCVNKQYRLYVNGAHAKTGLTSVRSASWAPHRFMVGGWNDPFTGAVDEVAEWSSVLSEARIAAHSAAVATPRPKASLDASKMHHELPPQLVRMRIGDNSTHNHPKTPGFPKFPKPRSGYWHTDPVRTRFPEAS